MDHSGQIATKREAAARARRMALHFTAADDRERALRFAAELEAEADALERQHSPAPPSVTQMQMQVQQGPPAGDNEAADESATKNKE